VATMTTIEVRAHKGSSTKFTVPNGTRLEIQNAIAERLCSDKELVWEDDPEGINVAVIANIPWRPRRRFFLTDENRPLLIEDKSSDALPNGEGE
jgi:hypothetical protein